MSLSHRYILSLALAMVITSLGFGQPKDFIPELLKIEDKNERTRLLKENRKSLNQDLIAALTQEGKRRQGTVPWPRVLEVYELGLEVARLLGDEREAAEALNRVAFALKNMVEPQRARAAYEEALGIFEKLGDKSGMARVNYGLSDIAENGSEILARALALAEEIGDRKLIADSLGKTGNRFAMAGEYVKAAELFRKALEIRQEIGDPDGLGIALSNLGILSHMLGDYANALKYLTEANRLTPNWIDTFNLGNIYSEIGDFGSAMSAFQRSIEMLHKADPKDEAAPVVINIANLYVKQGNSEQAEINYRKVLSVFERGKSNYGISRSLSGLSDVYEMRGDIKRAIDFAEQAHDIYLREKDEATAESFRRLARLYSLAGDDARALENLSKGLSHAESSASPASIFQSHLAIARFQVDKKDYRAALASVDAAVKAAGEYFELQDSWEYYSLNGRMKLGLGKLDEASNDFKMAIESLEKERSTISGGESEKYQYFSGKLEPYLSLIDIAEQRSENLDLLSLSEKIKARSLVDAITDSNKPTSDSRLNSDAEIVKEQALEAELRVLTQKANTQRSDPPKDKAAVESLIKQVDNKRAELDAFKNHLLAKYPELRLRRGQLEQFSAGDISQLLPNGSTIGVSYVFAKTKVYVISMTFDRGIPNVRVASVAISNDSVRKVIESFRTSIAAGNLDFQKPSKELYALLLKPVETQLAGKTNIIIVPDGPLWDLPFQALMDEKGKFLIEKAAVSYAPSLTALREMRKRALTRKPSPGAELLAFGNPIVGPQTKERVQRVFMSEKLEPIPEAERLVNSLSTMYGPKRSKVFTGADAREEVAKSESPKYRIVQFATHGILNNASPMYSHLVMAQNDKNPNEDGLLEAWELKDLDLKADMVILSACDTARGKISNGEGVIGMTWASFIAGAPTTVASQWKVESTSTTELMLEFHRQLLAKQRVSKAEALRRASLKLMRDPRFRHPSYWAGFVMVGDGS